MKSPCKVHENRYLLKENAEYIAIQNLIVHVLQVGLKNYCTSNSKQTVHAIPCIALGDLKQ